jgi:hypothetical protein
METIAHDGAGALRRTKAQRHFRVQLAIFLIVNAALVAILAAATLAGARVGGELWPWPVAVAIWGARVAIEGYAASHQRND